MTIDQLKSLTEDELSMLWFCINKVNPSILKEIELEFGSFEIKQIIGGKYNNIQNYFENTKDADSQTVVNRILEIIEHDKLLLSEDLIFNLIRNMVGKYPNRTNKLCFQDYFHFSI